MQFDPLFADIERQLEEALRRPGSPTAAATSAPSQPTAAPGPHGPPTQGGQPAQAPRPIGPPPAPAERTAPTDRSDAPDDHPAERPAGPPERPSSPADSLEAEMASLLGRDRGRDGT
jgi:hypothetical protein